jgi:hypothetical protein
MMQNTVMSVINNIFMTLFSGREFMKKIDISTKKYTNLYAIVSDEDYQYLNQFKWSFTNGYARRVSKKKTYLMHREIMNPQNGFVVDHINHDKLDNRRVNLRVCTQQKNTANRIKINGCTSKYKGVSWNKKNKNWNSEIMYNNKAIWLGCFKNEHDAGIAYNKKAIEIYGEYAYINKIQESA